MSISGRSELNLGEEYAALNLVNNVVNTTQLSTRSHGETKSVKVPGKHRHSAQSNRNIPDPGACTLPGRVLHCIRQFGGRVTLGYSRSSACATTTPGRSRHRGSLWLHDFCHDVEDEGVPKGSEGAGCTVQKERGWSGRGWAATLHPSHKAHERREVQYNKDRMRTILLSRLIAG
jgi:hypothetical protein